MIFTLGHSNHPLERFLGLLQQHAIEAVADVRSTPFSRRNPHFNRELLRASLEEAGVAYVPLGEELGARAGDPALYDEEGRVDFGRLAATPLFRLTGCEPPPLLDSPEERAAALRRAYAIRGRAIAYRRP